MKRHIYQELLGWKLKKNHKPLMLEGARQVGKTYLLKKFGREEYEHFYYLNFDETPDLKSLFEGSLSPSNIIEKLSIYFQTTIRPENSLICFDEIQECHGALASLKYFCEDGPEYHLVSAGSLLGVKLKGKKGFPVGKVTLKEIYPLSFTEFLLATEKHGWVSMLQQLEPTQKIPEIFHNGLLDALKKYMVIGGMPEVVNCYLSTQDFQEIRQTQKDILRTYELDFAKHASSHEVNKISMVWSNLPSQLAKENKKFIYSTIKPSARAREYESAIQWLIDANLTLKCAHISKPGIPIKSYASIDAFKLYLHDVGLLGAMGQLSTKALIQGEQLFQEFKGAITENFIAQSLISSSNDTLAYWTSDGRAEIDFIIEHQGNVLPIEVKSSATKRKKSLQVYQDKYSPKNSIRLSPQNLSLSKNLFNIPLYAVDELSRLLEKI